MIRSVVLATLALLPATASFAADGDACNPAMFELTCAESDIRICTKNEANQNVEQTATCASLLGTEGATCGTPSCGSASCEGVGIDCVAAAGGECLGFSLLLDDDPDNNVPMTCAGNQTCSTTFSEAGQLTETCVPHIGDACTAAGGSCAGSVLTSCRPGSEAGAVFASNIAIDCAVFGATCGKQPCECDANCANNTRCVDGFCDFGVICIDDVDPSECGAVAEGEGEGPSDGEGNNQGSTPRDDDDDGEEEDPPACSTTSASNGAPLTALAVLVLGVRSLRRRRA